VQTLKLMALFIFCVQVVQLLGVPDYDDVFTGVNPDGLEGISLPLTFRIGSCERDCSGAKKHCATLHYKDDYRVQGYLPR
jgi:hypothetical protein